SRTSRALRCVLACFRDRLVTVRARDRRVFASRDQSITKRAEMQRTERVGCAPMRPAWDDPPAMAYRAAADDVVEVDVLDVSDLRFEGGTAGSVAEEVRAQAAAGYSTALLHLDGPLQARVTPFNPAIRRCIDEGAAR